MYFGTYTPLLSLVLKTSEMSGHSKPDSLPFVKKLGLPLSTVPENYIWNQSSLIVQSLKNMFTWSSSNLSPHKSCFYSQENNINVSKCQKLSKRHPKLVIREKVSSSLQYVCRAMASNVLKARFPRKVSCASINSAWFSRLTAPPTPPWANGLLLSTNPPTHPLCAPLNHWSLL